MTGDELKRDEILYSDLSDIEVAHKVRMLFRDTLEHEVIVCGARDRIMWLSQENERLKKQIESPKPALAFFEYMKNKCREAVPELNINEPFTAANRYDLMASHIFILRCDWAIKLLIAADAGGVYVKK